MNNKIVTGDEADIQSLSDIFWNNLKSQPQYISHGEIQMGVAKAPNVTADDGLEMWEKYIKEKIVSDDSSVFVCKGDNDEIKGFTVVSIEEDGADPYGVICDILVLPTARHQGVGQALLDEGINWLSSRGVRDFYLESGKENHPAHKFFEKRGFEIVSHIYRKG
jgi:ribosomal protein S18 acetylase RimI-like enzyme